MMTTKLERGTTATIGRRSRRDEATGEVLSNKILRAYVRPRGQRSVEVEVSEDSVKVTALDLGTAIVDVIDEESEPSGTNYRFDVPGLPRREVGEAPVEVGFG